MGLEPTQDVLLQETRTEDASLAAEQAELTGLLYAGCVLEELQKVLKKPKPGKAPGCDAVVAEMILRGGSDLHACILTMFDRMVHGERRENLCVGLI